jgi:hypothetical protein
LKTARCPGAWSETAGWRRSSGEEEEEEEGEGVPARGRCARALAAGEVGAAQYCAVHTYAGMTAISPFRVKKSSPVSGRYPQPTTSLLGAKGEGGASDVTGGPRPRKARVRPSERRATERRSQPRALCGWWWREARPTARELRARGRG